MRNFLLNYLAYRGSNQISIYTDCNRVKGTIDEEPLKNTYTVPLNNLNIDGVILKSGFKAFHF